MGRKYYIKERDIENLICTQQHLQRERGHLEEEHIETIYKLSAESDEDKEDSDVRLSNLGFNGMEGSVEIVE